MSFLSDLFGGQSNKTKDLVNNLKPQKVYGFGDESGFNEDYLSRVKNRMAGRDVGYDQSFLDTATAPYAKDWRESFKNYTTPIVNAIASAKGVGRSTIPVSQIRTGEQEVENKIGTANAEIQKSNQNVKRNEIDDAMNKYYAYTKDDIGYKNMQSQADYANYLTSIGLSGEADKINTAMMQKMAVMGSVAVAALAAPVGAAVGGLVGAIPGLAGAGSAITSIGSGIGSTFQGINSSLVNIAGKNVDNSDLTKLKAALGIS